jgi:hypothetical protein
VSRTVIAYAIIGCEITDKIPKTEKIRGCEHPATDKPFCGDCGKPTTREVPIHPDDWGYQSDVDAKLKSHGLVRCGTAERPPRVFAGLGARANDSLPASIELLGVRTHWSDADSKIANARRALITLGLFDEATFGLWSVLYYS